MRCTIGLGSRPFKVTMPIGAPVIGSSTANHRMRRRDFIAGLVARRRGRWRARADEVIE
jgi:hypothetical protein